MADNKPRYAVRAAPGPIILGDGLRQHWRVCDMRPEPEEYQTIMGGTLTEAKAPPWRDVAYCVKEAHAQMICSLLNYVDHKLAVMAGEKKIHKPHFVDDDEHYYR